MSGDVLSHLGDVVVAALKLPGAAALVVDADQESPVLASVTLVHDTAVRYQRKRRLSREQKRHGHEMCEKQQNQGHPKDPKGHPEFVYYPTSHF